MDVELAAVVPQLPELPLSDVEGSRRKVAEMVTAAGAVDFGEVQVENVLVGTPAGDLKLRVFRPAGADSARLGILDIHGGGFVLGDVSINDAQNRDIARNVGAVVVSVDHRRAPEHPFPVPGEDCYVALVWLAEHATELGVDPGRLAVLGDSSGGCLAATAALLARYRGGPPLALQVLLEPALDDRLRTPSMLGGADAVGWNLQQARDMWRLYLGGGTAAPNATPARVEDLSDLPPTYIAVNELDPLRDEGIDYARRLLAAGVSTELHLWPGAYHGFFVYAPTADISRRAMAELHGVLSRH